MTEPTLSPGEVTDMIEKLKGMLQHVSDTFVNASQLAQTVASLQAQVADMQRDFADQSAAMQRDVEHWRQQYATLDETVQHIRQERDAAQSEAQSLRQENAGLVHDRDEAKQSVNALQDQVNELLARIAELRRGQDDAEYRAIHWEEEHGKVKAKLDAVHQSLGIPVQPSEAAQAPHPVERTGTGGGW